MKDIIIAFLATILLSVVIAVTENYSTDLYYILLGWYAVFPLTLFLLMLIAGFFFASKLTNVPYVLDQDGKIVPGFKGIFTSLGPGIIKIIVRDETPIRVIMNYQGRIFGKLKENTSNDAKEYNPEDDYYIVSGKSSNILQVLPFPILFTVRSLIFDLLIFQIRVLWWFWKVLIFKWTGRLFTGIYDWQELRVYKHEYLRLKDGELVMTSTLSDHFRAMDFDVYVRTPRAETADNAELDIDIQLICRVINPWLAAFSVPKSEGWYNRMSGVVAATVRDFYREVTYESALKDTTKLIDSLETLGKPPSGKKTRADTPIFNMGIEVVAAKIYKQDPTDPKLKEALSTIPKARANAAARAIDVDAEVNANKKLSGTMEGNLNAQTVYKTEATIRMVKELPKGAIVTVDTSSTGNKSSESDIILKGILSELKNDKDSAE